MTENVLQFLSTPAGRAARWAVSLVLGGAVGAVIHFILYRIALPVEPFIYVSF